VTPEQLSAEIAQCLKAAVAAQVLPSMAAEVEVVVERPRSREHGDWATNIAMVLAKPAGLSPRDVAADLVLRIEKLAGVKSANVAGPGFINIFIDPAATAQLAVQIIAKNNTYGTSNLLNGQTINVEFISANPTGPLHLGHTRWAAVGDAIGRVLAAAGATVVREFYINAKICPINFGNYQNRTNSRRWLSRRLHR
jgi:arginyl-tRNA synthetase